MVCCNCKKNISDEDLFCRFCGARQSKVIEKKWTEFRTVKLDFDMYSSLPLIIKEEYSRLFNLLDEGQNYGAVLQLRDIYEICLKIPVIISMAYICNKSKISEEEYRVLDVVIERELSCGTWHEIVRLLIKALEQWELVCILKEVDELWSWDGSRGVRGRRESINGFTSFSNWRNSTIGHGALAFDTQEDYYSQFEKMLIKLNEYFEYSYDAYSHICFGEGSKVILNNEQFELSPFVVTDDDGIYFFDAYLYGKKKYDILNYQNAKKNSFRKDKKEEQQLEALYRDVKGYLATLKSTSKMDADINNLYSDWHSIQEEELLDSSIMNKKYQRVDYLTDWAVEAINNNKFALLSMESGLGKSSWCRTFDERFCDTPETIIGYDIKVIYINRFYNKTTDSLLSALQDVLSLSSNGQRVIKLDNPRYINRKVDNKRQEVSEVIDFYYKKMHEVGVWKSDKLLLIFDGLDELMDYSFLQWLPSTEELGDNVRIIFTARVSDSLETLKENLEKNIDFHFKEENYLIVGNDAYENINLLTQYISKYGKDNNIRFTDNDINTLLVKAQNRFLYLAALLQIINNDNFSIPQENNIYWSVLDYLRKMYSEKYFHDIENILGLLTVASVPISVYELSQILGYGSPNYLLASYIKDLMPLLVIEYRDGDAYYSLAHEEVISAIKHAEWFDINSTLELWKNCMLDSAEQLTRIEREHMLSLDNVDFKGSIYAFVNMNILPNEFKNHFEESELQVILNGWCDICSWISDICIYSHLSANEKYNIYKNIYDLCEVLFKDKMYLLYESYLKMKFLSPEFIGFYGYSDEELEKDEEIVSLLAKCLWIYEERDMTLEELNIYERELMIYPALAGRVALKALLLHKKPYETYENKLADALKFATEIVETISENPRFCRHDVQVVKSVIRELSANCYTLIDKKILQKNRIQNVEEYLVIEDYNIYEYGELYKKSILLNMQAVKYYNSNAKIPSALLNDADELYDAIVSELEATSDRNAKHCLVSYFPPIVVLYKIYVCSNGNGFLSYLSKDRGIYIERIINIFEMYDKYSFVSHEIHHYINALVTYGISEFNVGNKENAVFYLKKTIAKYDYYKKQPYYRDLIEINGDICNAYYSLALHYGGIGAEKEMKKNLKEAQAIYRKYPALKKMFSMAPGMCAHLEGRSADTVQIKKVKIGRNDPCPCGSGKKYKHCCGK